MQKKFATRHEVEKYMDSKGKTVFPDSSPFSAISSPPQTVFTTLQGRLTDTGGYGTFSVFRHDSSDTVLLNKDDYSFVLDPYEEETEIKGPLKSENHHLDEIPSSLKSDSPKKIIDRVENLRSSIFSKMSTK